jgi:salicylate hydroxylase
MAPRLPKGVHYCCPDKLGALREETLVYLPSASSLSTTFDRHCIHPLSSSIFLAVIKRIIDLHAAMVGLGKVSNGDKPYQLHLVVIGAGLAGLSAAITTSLEGHRVTVLEKVSQLQDVGAGLQVTPNATRLLKRWGLFDELRKRAAAPSSLTVRRYDGSVMLAQEDSFQEKMQDKYDAPFWNLHRADLQKALVGRAIELGVEIRLDSEVIDFDFSAATVMLKGGEMVHGDVLLAADGLWSRSRSLFMQKTILPSPTGDLAWRIILNLEDLKDPELVEWVSKPTVNFWIGPYAHAVGYSVRGGKQFNLVLLSPDDLEKDLSRAEGNLDEMKKLFAAWDPMSDSYFISPRTKS